MKYNPSNQRLFLFKCFQRMNPTFEFFLTLTVVAVVVLVLSNIELFINKNNAVYSNKLCKTYEIIPPEKTNLKDPVVIFNTKKLHSRDLKLSSIYDKNNYIKQQMSEHIASKLNRPLIELIDILKHFKHTSMPINTLYQTISKGEETVMNADPSVSGTIEPEYKIIHSARDTVESFVSGERFYILKHGGNN